MRIVRDLLHCPKLLKLETLSGNPAAIKWLIALWGYCEKERAWRFPKMPPGRLADACLSILEGEQLLTFLIQSRWVEMDGETLVVRKWDQYNKGLIQRFEASEISRIKRSERSADDDRPHSGRQPTGQRPSTDRRPASREIDRRIDRNNAREETTRQGGKDEFNFINKAEKDRRERLRTEFRRRTLRLDTDPPPWRHPALVAHALPQPDPRTPDQLRADGFIELETGDWIHGQHCPHGFDQIGFPEPSKAQFEHCRKKLQEMKKKLADKTAFV